jgi:hypothetical protein
MGTVTVSLFSKYHALIASANSATLNKTYLKAFALTYNFCFGAIGGNRSPK